MEILITECPRVSERDPPDQLHQSVRGNVVKVDHERRDNDFALDNLPVTGMEFNSI
jgi:hypothetical protein